MIPKITVIMPVYNVDRYLQKSLMSVTHQTLNELEIICVNDGSTDNCESILKYFAENDQRIKVISTPNKGYGHAMNIGLKEATGKYIGIVEPDDFVKQNMFEFLYDAANIYDVDIVKSDFWRFTTHNSNLIKYYQPVAEKDFYHRVIKPENEKKCFRFMMNIWCGIYKHDFLEHNKILFNESEGASFQDNGFWFQTMCYCNKIIYLDEPFYMNRRDNPNSSVNQKDNVKASHDEYAYIREFLKKNPKLEQKYLSEYMVKKYQTYKFNLNRIDEEKKDKYLRILSQEWKNDYANGDMQKEMFLPEEWEEIALIMSDPIKYWAEVFNLSRNKTNKVFTEIIKKFRRRLKKGK